MIYVIVSLITESDTSVLWLREKVVGSEFLTCVIGAAGFYVRRREHWGLVVDWDASADSAIIIIATNTVI